MDDRTIERAWSSTVWRVTHRELRRIASDRRYPLLMFVLPLIGFGLLIATFSARTLTDLPIAVYDGDHSALSRQLIRWVDATRTMRVTTTLPDAQSAEDWLLHGHGYAVLVIPVGLQRDVFAGRAHPVVGYINGQWLLPASLISRDLRQTVVTLSKGVDLQLREARGQAPAIARASIDPVHLDPVALFNPQLDYITYLVMSLLPTLLQIFIVVLIVHAIGIELKQGTAGAWLQEARGNVWAAFVGKMIPYWVSGAILAFITYIILFGMLHIPIQGSALLVMLSLLMLVFACQGIGVLMIVVSANLRFATSIAAFVTGPAFAFTGVTFPTIGMPFVARAWGMLLPVTHTLFIMTQQASVGAPAWVSLPPLGALMIFAALPLVLMGRLRTILNTPSYWGHA